MTSPTSLWCMTDVTVDVADKTANIGGRFEHQGDPPAEFATEISFLALRLSPGFGDAFEKLARVRPEPWDVQVDEVSNDGGRHARPP